MKTRDEIAFSKAPAFRGPDTSTPKFCKVTFWAVSYHSITGDMSYVH